MISYTDNPDPQRRLWQSTLENGLMKLLESSTTDQMLFQEVDMLLNAPLPPSLPLPPPIDDDLKASQIHMGWSQLILGRVVPSMACSPICLTPSDECLPHTPPQPWHPLINKCHLSKAYLGPIDTKYGLFETTPSMTTYNRPGTTSV
jgi:hypothetical protein